MIVFGDPHVGMLAQARETGGSNWDLKIAKRVMTDALSLMITRLPKARYCKLINIGDYFHFQDNSKTTPTSKHQLDGDCRLMHMAELGCHLMAGLTQMALEEYENVEEHNVERAITTWTRRAGSTSSCAPTSRILAAGWISDVMPASTLYHDVRSRI